MTRLPGTTRRSTRAALLAWNRAVYEFDMAILREEQTGVRCVFPPDYQRAMLDCKHAGFASPAVVAHGGTA